MVLKITPKQRTKINVLVRKACCNCYKGNCLLLNDGEETKCVQLIKNHACDARPMVYKAVNWALRNIGKKNPRLTPKAVACAQEILDLYEDSKSARWVANNALWELNLPKTKAMVSKRK